MWKRDEGVRPTSGQPTAATQPFAPITAAGTPALRPEAGHHKGELNGSEDLTIEGHVEGTIQLREHVLTIGPNGRIKAQVFAKSVIVLGEVTGNVTASDKVDIRDNGSVDGDIVSPRVAIAEGAHFRGSVDMQRKPGQAAQGSAKPEVKAAGPQQPAAPQPQGIPPVHRVGA